MAGYIGKDSSGVILAESDPNAVPKTGGSFTGAVTVDETSASPLTLDRNSTDGSIVTLQKDGTTVGSIGTYSGYLNIANDSNGLALGDTVIYPSDASAGGTDGVVDLGGSSARFKDLYLSGGVYLGGTGSANYLDDYEEGTWTPTLVSFTETGTSTATGRYTKIGRMVYFSLEISTTGTIASTINTSRISGLPFQVSYNTVSTQGARASWGSGFKGFCLTYVDESIYTESFSAQDDVILMTGFYETS